MNIFGKLRACYRRRYLDNQAKRVIARFQSYGIDAEDLFREALALRSDAEGKHAAALQASDSLRMKLYGIDGYQGLRPAELVRLDDIERTALEQYYRCAWIAAEARKAMSAATPKTSNPENGNS